MAGARPAVTTLEPSLERPTTRATGHTAPAPAAAAAPGHRCAAARCRVPRHRPPAARRPACACVHVPRRDRTAKTAQRRPVPAAHTAQDRVPDRPRAPRCSTGHLVSASHRPRRRARRTDRRTARRQRRARERERSDSKGTEHHDEHSHYVIPFPLRRLLPKADANAIAPRIAANRASAEAGCDYRRGSA